MFHLATFAMTTSFLATLTLGEVMVKSHGVGDRDPSMDGKLSNDHVLFETDFTTTLACANACMKYRRCSAFTTSPNDPPRAVKKLACRGHESKMTLLRHTVNVAGSKTYVIRNRPPASSWLKRPCGNSNDCPATADNVECFADAGQCLCTIGFYYSHWFDGCVRVCPRPDLQPMFITYPKICIYGQNIGSYSSSNVEKCHEKCIQHSRCRTFELQEGYTCYLQEDTFLDPYTNTLKDTCDYHQLTCL